MKNNFEFILTEKFNSILNRDYEDADKALESGLFKSAVILYGGVVEGVLKYLLLTKVNDRKFQEALNKLKISKTRSYYKRIKKLKFHEVIILANKIKLIKEPGGPFLVKNFRNFVHIFKEIEENIEINKAEAETAKKFTNSIIKTLTDSLRDKIENGEIFFNSTKNQPQKARKKTINKSIIKDFYNKGYIDFSNRSGKFFGAHLGSMSKKGICQVDPLSWSVKTRRFQKRLFNTYFKKMAGNYLNSKNNK